MLDRIVLKEHQMFLVCDGNGDIAAHNIDGHGLYWHDTRFLSLFELSLDAGRPQLLSAAGEHNFMMTLQFANQAFQTADGKDVRPRTLSIRRNRFLHAALHERLGIFNYNPFPVPVTLSTDVRLRLPRHVRRSRVRPAVQAWRHRPAAARRSRHRPWLHWPRPDAPRDARPTSTASPPDW